MNKRISATELLTVPEEISGEEFLLLTGNEYLSLPLIDRGGGIRAINFIHFKQNGLLQFAGEGDIPLIEPLFVINEKPVAISSLAEWFYQGDWLPSFSYEDQAGLRFKGEIVTPPGFKGFYYRIAVENNSSNKIIACLGWQVNWKRFSYIVFNERNLDVKRVMAYNRWSKSLILEAYCGFPLAGLALAVDDDNFWQRNESGGYSNAAKVLSLAAGETAEAVLYGGVNLEGDGAGTTTVDLRRHGMVNLRERAEMWLENRRLEIDNEPLGALLNRNLFFNFFYAVGKSLDSDELIALTSRSPRYYVSAAFWSRDCLLWSFPAIMLVDQNTARELLLAVFNRHIKNAGDHAHYIGGTVLYPGFELDQLTAYLLALKHYLSSSDDFGILKERSIRDGLEILAEKAFERFVPEHGLFTTFLDPSDDPVICPYLTYNNSLLQCSFNFLGSLQAEELWDHKSDFQVLAAELQKTIYEQCVVNGPFGLMFAWSVDGNGRFTLYDNPPGSLQLLAHYGFCSYEDTVFKNTVRWIRSSNNEYFHQGKTFEEAGSRHAGNPWPLAACNDLLACNSGALDFFNRAEMDNGFFCETVNPETGKVSTGAAFASGAGFMAYALNKIRSPSQ